MITQQERDELVAFEGNGSAILSVFLDLSPDRQVQRSYQAAFTALVRQCEADLTPDDVQALTVEADRVRSLLAEQPHDGQGLAVFSCAPKGFWRVYPLPVVVEDAIHYGSKPWLRPLIDVMDDLQRFVVALVDKERARLFVVNLGEVEEERDIADAVPGRHDQGGWSQSRFQRHHDNAVMHHAKNIVEQLDDLLQERPFDRLVLVGPDEATAEVQRLLSRPLRDRLAGAYPGEFFSSSADMLQRMQEVMQRVERDDEARLVDQVLEFAGAGGRGTLGIEPTLDALWSGQVDVLVVARDAHEPGSDCPGCGRILRGNYGACPSCGTAMESLDDVVERAIARALSQSGRVEIVHDGAADRLREGGAGVGAILRYTVGSGGAPPG